MADSTSTDWTTLLGQLAPSLLNAAGNVYIGNRLSGAGEAAANKITQADTWGNIGGRTNAANQLNTFLQNPSSISSTPWFQFLQNQGMTNLDRKLASQGLSDSGNALREMSTFNQGLASTQATDWAKMLGGFSGATFNPLDAYAKAAQMQAQGTAGQLGAYGSALGGVTGTQGGQSAISSGTTALAKAISNWLGGSGSESTGPALTSYLQQLGISPQQYQLNSADELAGIGGDIAGNQALYDSLFGGGGSVDPAQMASWIDSADSGIDGFDWSSFGNAGSAANTASSGAGSALGSVGSFLPYVGGALSLGKIAQGNGSIGDYTTLGKLGYSAYTGQSPTLSNMYNSAASYFGPTAATTGVNAANGLGAAAGETMAGGALSGAAAAGSASPALVAAAGEGFGTGTAAGSAVGGSGGNIMAAAIIAALTQMYGMNREAAAEDSMRPYVMAQDRALINTNPGAYAQQIDYALNNPLNYDQLVQTFGDPAAYQKQFADFSQGMDPNMLVGQLGSSNFNQAFNTPGLTQDNILREFLGADNVLDNGYSSMPNPWLQGAAPTGRSAVSFLPTGANVNTDMGKELYLPSAANQTLWQPGFENTYTSPLNLLNEYQSGLGDSLQSRIQQYDSNLANDLWKYYSQLQFAPQQSAGDGSNMTFG